MFVLLMSGIYDIPLGWPQVTTFMKTDTGVQSILMLYLRNLKHSNVGTTDGRDL